jgi:precorrin-6B methylase 2
MPLVLNILERALFIQFNQGPGPLLDMFGGIAFRAVVAGIRMGVFEALDPGPLTVEELARRIDADERGTVMLLKALEALRYVRQSKGLYRNTAMTRKWLVSSSPTNFAPFCLFWGALLSSLMTNLEESIKSGTTPVNLYEWIEDQPEISANFQKAMTTMARYGGGEIIGKIKLRPQARRLLDVGGGHAMYSIALCEQYPALTATVIDSPQALQTARENVAAANMAQRIHLQEGNFLEADFGSDYDIALLFNIIHGLTPDMNLALLQKVATALCPGGQVVVLEQLTDSVPTSMARAASRLLNLSYFHLIEGQTYTYQDVTGWLKKAGFVDPEQRNLLKAPGNSLVIATKA